LFREPYCKNILVTALGDTHNQLEIVENSSRFLPAARKEILYDYALRSMSSSGIIYPYWENIARAKEDICAALYLVQMITFIVVVVLTLCYAWYRFKNRQWNVKMLWENGKGFAEKIIAEQKAKNKEDDF